MAATKTRSRKPATPAATELLAADHREVEVLFGKYRTMAETGAGAGDRRPLAEEICTLLTVHGAIEEEIFYPAARAAGVASDVLDEAEVEHASAKDLIAQIRDMDAGEDLYDAKVKVLGEYVEHHVHAEEDSLFPRCRVASMDLAGLGARLAARKTELMSEMSEGMDVVG
jgi:hemerythrin superfamily protein